MVVTNSKERKGTKEEKFRIPEELPILPQNEIVVYPSLIVPLATAEEKILKLIDDAASGDKLVGFFAQRPDSQEATDLYSVGTAAIIARMLKLPNNSVQVFFQGLSRIGLKKVTQVQPYLKAQVEVIEDKIEKTAELEALVRNLTGLFQKVVDLAPNLPSALNIAVLNMPDPGSLADFVAAHINLALEERQEILEAIDVAERIRKLTTFVNRELEVLELGSKIQSQAKEEMTKAQREFFLREQLKAIQKELGEADERTIEINELKEKIAAAKLPAEASKEAERELNRLTKMPPAAAEYTVSRTYLDWLLNLPWSKCTEDNLDISQASQVLDQDHYDLDKVKERILDYLAVRTLKPDMRGPILCFVGPPGTGKTSVGQSIARALGRKFVRISLGGIRDEADIRGHRRTYVGALPGRIIQGLRRAESNNPLFMLDEIDKVGTDFRGDPSAALLEVLDPEQNHSFVDHYLDVPFDLSQVMFITTANIVDPIPPALLDRMEVIELPGYTENEKLHIAKKFLIPKQLKENGLTTQQLEIEDEAVLGIIRNYTREAGLRNLEREIDTICRKIARRIAEGKKEPTIITADKLHDFLGARKFRYEIAEEADEVGVATGLAWTPAGGDVIFVEATTVPGKGNLILTGKLGDVMQESAKAALTHVRTLTACEQPKFDIPKNFYANNDIHIHVPAGAIPKDGPSAGITMAVALASAVTKHLVSKDVGMTGEITLRGKVLPVGGIRDKVLAAHRAGLKKVILPKENEKDLEEIPKEVKEDLQFIFVKSIDEALEHALNKAANTKS
ncbi:MAG: endopeptidase La [Dehalococcoidia bacterium]|nr:endopeptidase La [Dehalococcoidia bacterium]RLC65016.1 MAG: endopeptidase La [Chloroflexota bacterium]